MNGDYIKTELKRNSQYEYTFNEPLTVSELIDFYSNIENSGYFETYSYHVDVVTDEYDTGGSHIYASIKSINPNIFDRLDVMGTINMIGYIRGKVLGDSIHSCVNSNNIVVNCNDNGKILDIVESSFPRQKGLK